MQGKYFKFFIIGIITFSFSTFIISNNKFHLTLIWNTFLAVIPLYMLYLKKYTNHMLFKIFITLIWILFLPNSFYTLTDLIHIQSLDFYEINQNEVINSQQINVWLELLNIFLVSSFGFLIGCINVSLFVKKIHNILFKIIAIFSLSFLSAIGIYIGRFLQYNSWDILNPIHILYAFINNLNLFAIQFIAIITIFIFISCLLFYKRISSKFI